MSDNWVVTTLEDALSNWNDKLAEIWSLVSQTPESFRGGENSPEMQKRALFALLARLLRL